MKTYNLTQEQVNRLNNGESIKDVLPEAFTLEVGKWYKSNIDNIQRFYFFTKFEDKKRYVKRYFYGLKNGKFLKDYTSSNELDKSWTLATPQEVETALITEAKKRGYKGGVKVISLSSNNTCKLSNGQFAFDFKYNKIYFGGYTIFDNGKWATIVEKSKEEILNELIDYANGQDNVWLLNNLKKLRDEN